MKIGRRAAMAIAFCVASFIVGVSPASACDCHGAGPVCEEFWKTPVVFAGRVESRTPVAGEADVFRVRLQVIEALRGVSAAYVDVYVSNTNCALPLAPGEEWLIYAFPSRAGLGTGVCTRSQRLKNGLRDLAYARNADTLSSNEGRVFGRLVHAVQHRIVPLPGLRVALHRPPFDSVVTTTDEQGGFSALVSRGIYELRPELPPGMFVQSESLFDGKSWRLVSETGAGERAHHSMAFDATRNQVVLFGNSDQALTNDTWGWDGRAWQRPASDGPPRRGVQAFAADPKRGVIVMFGGVGSRSAILNDTWEWDGREWTQIATANAPSPRFDTRMIYDPAGGRMLLFGGRGAAGNLGDTWAYDGRAWVRLEIRSPSPRNGHAMVYDPRAKAVLLFGGRNEPEYFDDLWAFDGAWRVIPHAEYRHD